MEIYCINLDDRPERWARMLDVADRAGVTLNRISALGPQDIARMTADGHPDVSGDFGTMGPERIGCALSHLACWRALLASDAPWAVVLEDDVVLADGFADFLNKAQWPADADLIRIEVATQFATLDRIEPFMPGQRKIGRLLSPQNGSGGYVLTRKAAENLVADMNGFQIPVDLYLFTPQSFVPRGLTVYQDTPAPVQQGCLMREHAAADWAQSSLDEEFIQKHMAAGQDNASPNARRASKDIARRARAVVRRLRGRVKTELRFG